jgi:zinc/manganese transport system substrate-binding protein
MVRIVFKEVLQNSLRASGAQNRDAMQGGFRSRYPKISARNPTKQGARVWDATTHGVLWDFLKFCLSSALALSGVCTHAQALFACEPEWAALARVLLPQAQIAVATSPLQDPHHIEARPALIAQLRNAEMALCSGAGLEDGWMPVLQQKSGNARVQNGQPGMFWATEGQSLIGRQAASGSPFEGDVHPEGNPHIHANPQRLLQAAQALATRMAKVWPAHGPAIEQRLREFEGRWLTHISRWQQSAAPLRGAKVAAQHTHFAYLFEWLGLQQVADLEPKPGLSPTPAHLQRLAQQWVAMRPPLRGLAVASHQDPRAARWMGQQVPGLTVWVWPATVTAGGEEDLVRWFDALLADLTRAPS